MALRVAGLTGAHLTALLALAALAAPVRADSASCGRPGAPPCPLQKWMRSHAAAPLAEGRWDELAANLERVRELNPRPDDWQNWDQFARKGAAAAREQQRGTVKQTCTNCHEVYRRRYNQHFRKRAVR